MDMNLLKYYMGNHGDRQSDLAKALGFSASALSSRMHGKTDFRKSEIETIRDRYHLNANDVQAIFFAQ